MCGSRACIAQGGRTFSECDAAEDEGGERRSLACAQLALSERLIGQGGRALRESDEYQRPGWAVFE